MKYKFKLFLNDNGFFAMAFAVVLVSLMSVIAIARIGVTDTVGLVNGYQAFQELHLLRSESDRSHKLTLSANGPFSLGGGFASLPSIVDLGAVERTYLSGFGSSTFRVRTIAEKEADVVAGAFNVSNVYAVKSLITARVGNRNDSPIEIYSKRIFRNESYAGYHYFTDNESSINSDIGDPIVKFYGKDEIHGRVRSNTDIYIQNTGVGNNGGWPTFFDEVYTSGEVVSVSGNYPLTQVFRKGLTENLPELEFPETAVDARTGRHIEVSEDGIIFATVSGSSYTSYRGTRLVGPVDSVMVYGVNWEPSLGGQQDINDINLNQLSEVVLDTLAYHYLSRIDTLWTSGPNGQVANDALFVEGELWLQGTFTGSQTWATSETMYLAGDILLSGTNKGESPDGLDEDGESVGPINNRDMVGLVSEQSILIQYGYRSIEDSIRVKNNCGRYEDLDGDEGDGGIYIYAAMIALGDGETSMEDGIFSFEYQHPHSALFTLWRDEQSDDPWGLGDLIELDNSTIFRHRLMHDGWGPLHSWPFTVGSWLPIYQYPFSNQFWPESKAETFLERGTIHIYGSVAQRRRGFVHRSGSDNDNTGNPGEWDIANYKYGAHPNSLGASNAPGTSGGGVGYNKSYNYDNRFRTNPPPKFPEAQLKGGVSQFDPDSWYLLVGKDAPQILRN